MKILLAYEWCEIGGVEQFMTSLAPFVRARGHECEFFFFKRGPMEQFLPEGYAAHFGDLAALLKLVRARGYDVVHANSGDWKYGIEAVRAAGARLVITAHGMVVPGWDSANCDALVCCSRWQAREQTKSTDMPVRLIMNAVDTGRFSPAAGHGADAGRGAADGGGPVVAWVGRGTDMVHKRIDRLAAVAPALRSAGMRIWIADPYGPEKVAEVVPEAARTLGEHAEFWGMVAKNDLPDFYRRVAESGGCILSTSVREGLPLTLAEAQGCGCPAVGPDVVGVNEVISPAEGGGTLYPPDITPERLAALLIETLGDPAGMRGRRAKCVEFVRRHFGLEVMAEAYLNVYEEAAGRRAPRTSAPRTLRLLPRWRDYVERRWTAGVAVYEASERLAAEGETELASAAARLVLVNCPTLYARPARLRHLLRLALRPGSFGSPEAAAPRGN
ncbi:MAG TPA: glycosyltransferase family 4 protein [Pyrinomonadaceae bacterium]|jgi:glycosyltransferase involved in cell wall biosynthesis